MKLSFLPLLSLHIKENNKINSPEGRLLLFWARENDVKGVFSLFLRMTVLVGKILRGEHAPFPGKPRGGALQGCCPSLLFSLCIYLQPFNSSSEPSRKGCSLLAKSRKPVAIEAFKVEISMMHQSMASYNLQPNLPLACSMLS